MNKQKLVSIILGLILVTICFLPILKSGLYSDDLQNFQLKASLSNHSVSVYDLASKNIEKWKGFGRYTPISLLWMECIFNYFTSIESYKFFVFIINILAVLAFLFYLHSLKLKMNYSLWLICFASVIQYRITYHDAYTSLNGMYQVLAICIFAGLTSYCYYILNGKWWVLLLALLFFISSILISEIGLMLLFLIPVSSVILRVPLKKIIISFIPFMTVAVCYLGYTFWLRMHVNANDSYVGLTTNMSFEAMTTLFFKQVFAAFPLTNLFQKRGLPNILFHQLSDIRNIIGFTGIIFLSYFIYKSCKAKEFKTNLDSSYKYILISIAFIVFPALFILPSIKYQTEVQWGVGYLPVYFQNFGTATFFYFIIQYGLNNYKKIFQRISKVVFVFIVSGSCIAFLFNNALIKACTYNKSFPAQVFYDAIKSGILNECEAGSTIILGHDFYWKSPSIYQEIFKNSTGKIFKVYDFDVKEKVDANSTCYFLDCQPGNIVYVSLYEIDKKNRLVLLMKTETICDIEINKDENKMFH